MRRSSGSSSAIKTVIGLPWLVTALISLGLGNRQRHEEGRAVAGAAVGGDTAAVSLDDLAANRQAHSGPLLFAPAVEPLENIKDPIGVFYVETDAVVLHGQPADGAGGNAGGGGQRARVGQHFTLNLDDRRLARLVEFQCVAD